MSRVARVLTVGFFSEEADVFYPREPGLHQTGMALPYLARASTAM